MKNSASRIARYKKNAISFDSFESAPAAVMTRASRRGAAEQLSGVKVAAQPLLKVQRLSLRANSVMAVCQDVRTAQRYFCEAAQGLERDHHSFILHELMPAFQQDYTLDCLRGAKSFVVDCPVVVFMTAAWYQRLVETEPGLIENFKIVEIGNRSGGAAKVLVDDEPTVTCICLRIGHGGRWILMDHDEAAVVSPSRVPSSELVERLMRHTVSISGRYLAPYLAMMFDVPRAWKHHPELATCALLVFDQDRCDTGCNLPGIPAKIIWNDVLGIVCGE